MILHARITVAVLLMSSVIGIKLSGQITKREAQLIFNKGYLINRNYDYNSAKTAFQTRTRREASIKYQNFDEKSEAYMDEEKNVLFGFGTQMFIARLNTSQVNNRESKIYYEKVSFPVPSRVMKFYQKAINESNFTRVADENKTQRKPQNFIAKLFTSLFFKSLLKKSENKSLVDSSPKGNDRLRREIKFLNNSSKSESKLNVIDTGFVKLPGFYTLMNKESSEFSYKFYNERIKKYRVALEIYRALNVNPVKQDDNSFTVYPEILIVVDYETFLFYDKNYETLANYMAAFWNAVDLRFRQMSNPKIRLNIAGLVVPETANVEPYFERHPHDPTFYKGYETRDFLGDYFYTNFQNKLGNYDIVVGMTPLGLVKHKNLEVHGLSKLFGVCKGKESVMLITDLGFDGVTTAVHELGHLFGAMHDGEDRENFCPPVGHVMSRYWNETSIRWSHCSIDSMETTIRLQGGCLLNKPDVVVPHLKRLPGKLLPRNQQCEVFYGSEYYSVNEESCTKLTCRKCYEVPYIKISYSCTDSIWSKPPAEGSSCGDYKFCLDGNCVNDPGWYNE